MKPTEWSQSAVCRTLKTMFYGLSKSSSSSPNGRIAWYEEGIAKEDLQYKRTPCQAPHAAEFTGDDKSQDSHSFLKAFGFYATPVIPQHQGYMGNEAKIFLLESVLPDESTAKKWVVNQDDEVRDVWSVLKEAFIKRFPKKGNPMYFRNR